MSHYSQTLIVDFVEFFFGKTTFEEFEEICEQIQKEIHYNDEIEIIDSKIDLLRKFQLRNMFLNI